jgi:hypothetical protein
MSTETGMTDQEWKDRRLCSDGNCIGVIGPDGRCKECGKPHGTPGADPHPGQDAPEDEVPAAAAAPPDAPPATGEDAPAATGDDEWGQRTLCSDGNCIGVIGPDGRCKECGKPYAPEPAQ